MKRADVWGGTPILTVTWDLGAVFERTLARFVCVCLSALRLVKILVQV
eukprot:COSAG05_NODE_4383_length_1537_cov_1.078581_2_plen_47_part_01